MMPLLPPPRKSDKASRKPSGGQTFSLRQPGDHSLFGLRPVALRPTLSSSLPFRGVFSMDRQYQAQNPCVNREIFVAPQALFGGALGAHSPPDSRRRREAQAYFDLRRRQRRERKVVPGRYDPSGTTFMVAGSAVTRPLWAPYQRIGEAPTPWSLFGVGAKPVVDTPTKLAPPVFGPLWLAHQLPCTVTFVASLSKMP